VHPDRGQGDVVHHRQVGEEVVGLEDHAHPGPHGVRIDARVGDVVPGERDPTVVDDLEQVDAPQQGRLARAAGADEHDALAALDGQVDVLEHDVLPERLPDPLEGAGS
jgi:hypothetical protein